ncbi:class I tRNA ligase family protein [Patescibacteria group bacterium]|nr:class I tRNA ligase family protein [Patescibacteria group bacterium]MCG2690600.1 class I tRNA ligase family protein [Candidatus Parcubacteria bacterium]
MKEKKFYITTPIYYVNDIPHIGSAYTTVAADVLARYHRMIGDRTFFLTGTDEHGAKIEKAAEKAGKNPKEFVDELAAKFELAWDELDISHDKFIRTTDENHIKAARNAMQYLYDKGFIYKGEYEGLYCLGCEQYKTEKELVGGKCPDHGTEPQKMKEECYMFKLSAFQDRILELIKKDELLVRPAERKNEIVSFLKNNPLSDISCSRKTVKWGIELPWDKEHTVYVWLEAFLNYLTGLGWDGRSPLHPPCEGGQSPLHPPCEGGQSPLIPLAKGGMWPPDVQLMSKDILRVHATIWPAMLLALNLPLPKQLFIHGFFLVDGKKMSKSLGNVIAPRDLIDKYGVDGARYLLMSATPFGHDGDVGWEKFDEKYNADLANGIGNLVARSVTLAEKMFAKNSGMQNIDENFQFSIFNFQIIFNNQFSIPTEDMKIKNVCQTYQDNFSLLKLEKVVDIINLQIKFLDSFITAVKPWEMIKNKDEEIGKIMYNILERLRIVSWMVWPFMPETAEKIWRQLGLKPAEEMKKDFNEAIKWGGLKPGTKIQKAEVLFPRVN